VPKGGGNLGGPKGMNLGVLRGSTCYIPGKFSFFGSSVSTQQWAWPFTAGVPLFSQISVAMRLKYGEIFYDSVA